MNMKLSGAIKFGIWGGAVWLFSIIFPLFIQSIKSNFEIPGWIRLIAGLFGSDLIAIISGPIGILVLLLFIYFDSKNFLKSGRKMNPGARTIFYSFVFILLLITSNFFIEKFGSSPFFMQHIVISTTFIVYLAWRIGLMPRISKVDNSKILSEHPSSVVFLVLSLILAIYIWFLMTIAWAWG